MILLYFVLDICFYNYTHWKTHLFLLAFLEKKEDKFLLFLEFLFMEILLQAKGKFLLILFLLYFLEQKVKIPNTSIFKNIKHFFLLFFTYQILTVFFYQTHVLSMGGIIIDILFLILSYKNPFKA